MKISTKKISLFAASAALLATVAARPLLAQTGGSGGGAPASAARFSVDIKDATLMDALQLVFVAASVRDYSIDPSAKAVRVGSLSFKNQPWRDIVRSLASLNKFRFAREGSLWIVQPRLTNMSTDSVFASSTRVSAKKSDFSVEMRTSNQFGNSGSGSSGGGSGNSGATSVTVLAKPVANQSNSPWSIIEPNHTYAGALALLFQGSVVFSTEEQVVPGSWVRGLLLADDLIGDDNGNNNSSGGSNSNNNR